MRLTALVLVLAAVSAARAVQIPHYRMDSFAFLSDAVVLVDEEDIQVKEIKHEKWTEYKTAVRCTIVRTFKGELKAGSLFVVEYSSTFHRHLAEYTPLGTHAKVPAGRALLFLKKKDDSYSVVTAKLIQGNKVFQFGQFLSNPGPLVLARQGPENLEVPAGHDYAETELIEDLLVALKNALLLKESQPIDLFSTLIR